MTKCFNYYKVLGIPKHHLKKLQDFNKGRIDKAAITLSIKLSDLFDSRDKVTVSTCTKDSGNEIKYCEITLQMETPLMSDWQRRSLNPMTVTIMDCSSMPPISSYKKERLINNLKSNLINHIL